MADINIHSVHYIYLMTDLIDNLPYGFTYVLVHQPYKFYFKYSSGRQDYLVFNFYNVNMLLLSLNDTRNRHYYNFSPRTKLKDLKYKILFNKIIEENRLYIDPNSDSPLGVDNYITLRNALISLINELIRKINRENNLNLRILIESELPTREQVLQVAINEEIAVRVNTNTRDYMPLIPRVQRTLREYSRMRAADIAAHRTAVEARIRPVVEAEFGVQVTAMQATAPVRQNDEEDDDDNDEAPAPAPAPVRQIQARVPDAVNPELNFGLNTELLGPESQEKKEIMLKHPIKKILEKIKDDNIKDGYNLGFSFIVNEKYKHSLTTPNRASITQSYGLNGRIFFDKKNIKDLYENIFTYSGNKVNKYTKPFFKITYTEPRRDENKAINAG